MIVRGSGSRPAPDPCLVRAAAQRAGRRIHPLRGGGLERIDRNPEGYAVVYEGLRRAMTRRFPYAVYFRIAEGEVVIVGVFHMRRHPQKWQQRSKL